MSLDALHDVTLRHAVVRVDLLPPGLDDERRRRRVQAGLGGGLLLVVAALGAAWLVGAGHVSAAEDDLADAESRTAALQAQQRRYAEVPQVARELEAAQSAQRAVNAYTVDWASTLDAIAGNVPQRSSFDTLTLALDETATAPGGTGTTAPADPLGVPGVGTLSLTGVTSSQAEVASVLEGLGRVRGLAKPLVSSSNLAPDAGTVTYTTSATITRDALLNQ